MSSEELTKVKVIDHIIHSEDDSMVDYDDDSCWIRADTYEDHHITGITVCGKDEYADIEVAFPIDDNKTYYLVYAIYDTGDSFGRDYGKLEVVGLFQNKDKAEAVKNVCKDSEEFSSLILKTEDDVEYDYYPPWYGFFEHLQGVYVQIVRVQ